MMRTIAAAGLAGLLLATAARADDLKKMQGEWQVVGLEKGGVKTPAEDLKKGDLKLAIDGNKFKYFAAGKHVMSGTFKLDEKKKPPTIDTEGKDDGGKEDASHGIYELKDDAIRVCFVAKGGTRPEKFQTKERTETVMITYQRVAK